MQSTVLDRAQAQDESYFARESAGTWWKLPEPVVQGILGRDDANVHRAGLPDAVLCQEVIHLVQTLTKLPDELIDVVHQPQWHVLLHSTNRLAKQTSCNFSLQPPADSFMMCSPQMQSHASMSVYTFHTFKNPKLDSSGISAPGVTDKVLNSPMPRLLVEHRQHGGVPPKLFRRTPSAGTRMEIMRTTAR